MAESLEDSKEENLKYGLEPNMDVLPIQSPEIIKEVEQESPETVREEIEDLKREISESEDDNITLKSEVVDPQVREEKIKEYQGKYLPKYLRKKGMSALCKVASYFGANRDKFEREGQENIPESGPYIVICNHFGGVMGTEDSTTLLRTFKDANLHLAVGKEIWWDKSPITKWFFKKMGTIPVEESLSNLTEEQKEEALERQGTKSAKKVFRKIIDREKDGRLTTNVEFIRQAVALLSRGDAVGVYPEGLWLDPQGPAKIREREELKQGYRGIELIAGQYKKLTGEELPILPTAAIEDKITGKRKVIIGKPLLLSENESGENDTDWCMTHVAQMLPEKQRGYYKNKTKK